MEMLFEKVHPTQYETINLTPLLDVMFQLILFFMLTSNMTDQSTYTMDIEPPATNESSESVSNNEPVVRVTKDNKFLFQSQETDFEGLKPRLEQYYMKNSRPITVLADKDSSLWPNLMILDYCRGRRFRVQYLVEKEQE